MDLQDTGQQMYAKCVMTRPTHIKLYNKLEHFTITFTFPQQKGIMHDSVVCLCCHAFSINML